jgi:transcriptional regulator with XRE-family HTH domain
MDFRSEVRAFLQAHRAGISPVVAGFACEGERRRVPGLRREEVAELAGVSVDYYIRIERGDLKGVSDDVLAAIARALRLDAEETEHFFYLASHLRPGARAAHRPASPSIVRPGLRRVLDTVTGGAAWISNERMDLVAANRMGCAIHVPLFDMPGRPVNNARFIFLDPGAPTYYRAWGQMADEAAAMLRGMPDAAHQPMRDLVDELLAESAEFRARWEAQHVMRFRGGQRTLGHPAVGDLDVGLEVLDVTADPGLSLLVYYPQDSPTAQERWARLETWAAAQPAERFRI